MMYWMGGGGGKEGHNIKFDVMDGWWEGLRAEQETHDTEFVVIDGWGGDLRGGKGRP
jgi:hypothetical protein